ncbi:hypothetical protein EG835_02195 [bacterium]|nr:hypothetical protein [bacterium]
MAANTVAIVRAASFYDSPGVALGIGIASLAAVGGGYGLASSLVSVALAPRPASPASLELPFPADPRIVVLLLASLEYERYSPRRVAIQLDQLADEALVQAGMALSPFLYAASKARYRAIGGTSPAPAEARRLAARLGEVLAAHERFARVELVDCTAPESLAETTASLAARGFARFVVLELSVAASVDCDRSKSAIAALRPDSTGLILAYAQPLWGSQDLAAEMARRILAAVGNTERSGVALVMHGQPDSRQRSHPDYDTQETAFCNRVRMLVAEGGVADLNVRLCSHDWQTPDVSETVRHLAAVGCEHVIVAPVCFPLQGTQTLLDLAVAVNQARVDEHVSTLVLPAWGESEVIAGILRDRVLETSREIEAFD